ncbi:MAG: hypothetical protein ACPIOQ_75980, partial [Promethearchaeia archaeon]
MAAFEFKMPNLHSAEPTSAVGDQLSFSIMTRDMRAAAVSNLDFAYFDDTITLAILEGSDAPGAGNTKVVVALTNFDLRKNALKQTVRALFGSAEAKRIEDAGEHPLCPKNHTCLVLTAPRASEACPECALESTVQGGNGKNMASRMKAAARRAKGALGSHPVKLSLSLKNDPSRAASTLFFYWSAPVVSSAVITPAGTSVQILFDQKTDRGGMSVKSRNCSILLDAKSLGLMADNPVDSRCVWSASDELHIYLGPGASVVPGDVLRFSGQVKSFNGRSSACISEPVVSAPQLAVAPQVSVMGNDEIDPCSVLELRAMADSPRPL